MKKLFVLLVLALIAGCAGVTVQKYYKDTTFPATRPANIVIFPQKPLGSGFMEIGEITVTGANDWPQVEKIFRTKAAEMGADAVYVFSQQQEARQYISPDDCYLREGYYYPYHHFGWHHYRPGYYYPRGYYYCYGYQSVQTDVFISAVGIAIKYKNSVSAAQ